MPYLNSDVLMDLMERVWVLLVMARRVALHFGTLSGSGTVTSARRFASVEWALLRQRCHHHVRLPSGVARVMPFGSFALLVDWSWWVEGVESWLNLQQSLTISHHDS